MSSFRRLLLAAALATSNLQGISPAVAENQPLAERWVFSRGSGSGLLATVPLRPQTPQPPFPYVEREVDIRHHAAGITLSGTLLEPLGEGPFPAVVLVSGSGPHDRDESLLGLKPFRVLADHLARHGIAVLRYDDRGVGRSTGDFLAATTQDFAGDARAAVKFLQGVAQVDPARVGVIGHSEGGLVATMLAASELPLAHVVLLAGPGVPGDMIIESQITAMLEAAGMESAEIDKQLADMRSVITHVKEGESASQLKQMIASFVSQHLFAELESPFARVAAKQAHARRLRQLSTAWFSFFLNYDPRPDLRNVRCPVLALVGEKDLQVLPHVNLPEIRAALEVGQRADCRCEMLPRLNHLFQTAVTGSPLEYRHLEETMSPTALDRVTHWIREH